MTGLRRAASSLLTIIIQHAPADTRTWGQAMLREIDYIEGDWSAVCWALGSSTAVGRHWVSQLGRSLRASVREALSPSGLTVVKSRMPALLSGYALAGVVLTISMLGLSIVIHAPWFEPTQQRLAERLLILVLPESVYAVSAMMLWRQRQSLALGILAAGVTLIVHAIVFSVTHRS